jgi:hypothetical protein
MIVYPCAGGGWLAGVGAGGVQRRRCAGRARRARVVRRCWLTGHVTFSLRGEGGEGGLMTVAGQGAGIRTGYRVEPRAYRVARIYKQVQGGADIQTSTGWSGYSNKYRVERIFKQVQGGRKHGVGPPYAAYVAVVCACMRTPRTCAQGTAVSMRRVPHALGRQSAQGMRGCSSKYRWA